MYSKIEAAYIILKKNKKPMHPKEIIKIALDKKMIKTSGMTPADTLRVDVHLENKRRIAAKNDIRFIKLDHGFIGLTEWNTKK